MVIAFLPRPFSDEIGAKGGLIRPSASSQVHGSGRGLQLAYEDLVVILIE